MSFLQAVEMSQCKRGKTLGESMNSNREAEYCDSRYISVEVVFLQHTFALRATVMQTCQVQVMGGVCVVCCIPSVLSFNT